MRMIQRIISQLEKRNIPDGSSVNVQIINGATSLVVNYNEGRRQSAARLKVYIDEAVTDLD